MSYQQVPRSICHKFFKFPAVVPNHFKVGFMPKVNDGNTRPDPIEIEQWCRSNLGLKDDRWTRRSIYFFFDENDAFMFKMRWC
jgi:hypothetical protein